MDNEKHGDAAILARVENEILQRRADLGLLNQAKKEKWGRHIETVGRYKELRFDAIKAEPKNMAPPPATRSHFLEPVSPLANLAIKGMQWVLFLDMARWTLIALIKPSVLDFAYLLCGGFGIIIAAMALFILIQQNEPAFRAWILVLSLLSFPMTWRLLPYLAPPDGSLLTLYAATKLADIVFALLLIPRVGRCFFLSLDPPCD